MDDDSEILKNHPLCFFKLYLVEILVIDMSTRKGQKRIKNQPVLHAEMKKQRAVWLTSSSWEQVQEVAVKLKISASEYIEKLIRERHHE